MKVWIVIAEESGYDYDAYEVEKIFSSEVAAEHYVKMREEEETSLKKRDPERDKLWINLIEREVED